MKKKSRLLFFIIYAAAAFFFCTEKWCGIFKNLLETQPFFKNCTYLIIFELFFLLHEQKTKSARGRRRERSNQKVEKYKPALKWNFLSKSKWAGLDLTEPYWTPTIHAFVSPY